MIIVYNNSARIRVMRTRFLTPFLPLYAISVTDMKALSVIKSIKF